MSVIGQPARYIWINSLGVNVVVVGLANISRITIRNSHLANHVSQAMFFHWRRIEYCTAGMGLSLTQDEGHRNCAR